MRGQCRLQRAGAVLVRRTLSLLLAMSQKSRLRRVPFLFYRRDPAGVRSVLSMTGVTKQLFKVRAAPLITGGTRTF